MARKKRKINEPEVVLDIFGEDVVIEPPLDEADFKRPRVKLFDFMNDLQQNKHNILRQNPLSETDFAPFIINRAMSMGIDTVLYANEMNFHRCLDKQMLYDFYIFAIRPGFRRNPWAKEKSDEDLNMVREYYQLSLTKARSAMLILTEEEIADIKIKMNKGTVGKPKKVN